MNYIKNCPTCNKEIFYSDKKALKISIKRNSDCKTCSALKREPKSEETKKKISQTLTGRTVPGDVVEKIKTSMVERWKDIDYREKLLPTRQGKNNGMYGKHHNDEMKNKISKITKEKMQSPGVKEKVIKFHKSKEYREKLSEVSGGENTF